MFGCGALSRATPKTWPVWAAGTMNVFSAGASSPWPPTLDMSITTADGPLPLTVT